MIKLTVSLTQVEVRHILRHLLDNDQSMSDSYYYYYGNKSHFQKRHKKLIELLEEAAND